MFRVSNNPPTHGLLQLQLSQLYLKKYLQIYNTTQRTTARLSMLCKMRYRLISHEDAKLQSAGHSYSTRSLEYSHALPTAIRDYYKYSFYPRTITEWNKLPRKIELSNSLAAFKNAISNIY